MPTLLPLVYSVDELAGIEIRATERRLASLLASKLHREYSEMAFFIHTHMNLAIVRANTILLCSSQEKGHKNLANFVQSEDGAAMNAMDFMREW